MLYYFVEFAGSFANIALLLLFIGRLFPKKEPVSRWFYAYVALLIAGQCALSLFPDWVTQRTIYLLVGGFFLALLFYEVRPWQAVFASGAFFTLIALVEVLAMLLIGLRIPDTDILMQAGAARLVYVVFSNLIQIPLVVLISHFFSRKGNALRILWLLPIIAIQIASIAVCYVAQYASTKSVAQQLKTAKRPAVFEEQHHAELTAYRTAAAYLKANNITKLPSPNKLEAEYCALASEKAQFYEQYKEAKIELLKLKDAKQNVALFFREDERTQHHER